MKMKITCVCAAALAGFMALCRMLPNLAALWQASVSRPALLTLNRLTARWSFPLLEITAGAALLCWPARRKAVIAALALPCVLLWYPCYCVEPAQYGSKDAAALNALYMELSQALSDDTAFPTAETAALAAPEAAGMTGCRVKRARYPEWMRALGLSGLFSPWTGEAIIDPDAPRALIPFTAVHELMHLSGIADEGTANIEAWQRCIAQGGAFADSARAYALCRAAHALNATKAAPSFPLWARLWGVENGATSYDRLLNWLIEHPNSR